MSMVFRWERTLSSSSLGLDTELVKTGLLNTKLVYQILDTN